jgi:hypothetical protein
LSGLSPFGANSDKETFENINKGDFTFDDELWDNVSDDAVDFISRVLVKDKK